MVWPRNTPASPRFFQTKRIIRERRNLEPSGTRKTTEGGPKGSRGSANQCGGMAQLAARGLAALQSQLNSNPSSPTLLAEHAENPPPSACLTETPGIASASNAKFTKVAPFSIDQIAADRERRTTLFGFPFQARTASPRLFSKTTCHQCVFRALRTAVSGSARKAIASGHQLKICQLTHQLLDHESPVSPIPPQTD
jgi:hypothetical protein